MKRKLFFLCKLLLQHSYILLVITGLFFIARHSLAQTNDIFISAYEETSSIELANYSDPNYIFIPTEEEKIQTILDVYPKLRKIAWCESGQGSGLPYRQFEADGSPFKSRLGTPDWGATQISDWAWADKAKALGLDYKHSLLDNLEMAVYIIHDQGYEAWAASESCWNR